MTRLIETTRGLVEVATSDADGAWVLYFHGGHESASVALAAPLYAELGYRVLAISRPGYGRTNIGRLSPLEFAPCVDEVCDRLAVDVIAGVVGVSFGGPQAIAFAAEFPDRVGSLILHSAAPSTHAYPDRALQRVLGPLVFHPVIEAFTWAAIARFLQLAPKVGLREMMRSLTNRNVNDVLRELTADERQSIVAMFCRLRSGRGFNNDVRWAAKKYSDLRREEQRRVKCPTLVTASHADRGVAWEHAADFAATIPRAQLVPVEASSHLFWIGPAHAALANVVTNFLGSVPTA